MNMANFFQRVIFRGGENDRQNVAISETHSLAEKETKKLTTAMADWFEERSRSVSNIPELKSSSRRPTTLRLFGSSKKFQSDVASRDSFDLQDSKTATTRLVEDVVKEFEDDYKSPTRTPSKKSKNFVKKLVAALERKHQLNEVDETYAMRNRSGPIYAYDKFGIANKSEMNGRDKNNAEVHSSEVKNVTDEETVKAQEATSNKSSPKIIGAFLKKPVEVEETSIYWIPITSGKKLPRKKSFKKLLAKLRGRNGGKIFDTPTKQVVFASQNNLVEEIHDSGYEGRSQSSRASSLTSFTDTLLYENDSIDHGYKECKFSTFLTSSPLKKAQAGRQMVEKSKDLPEFFTGKKTTSGMVESREDSGYFTNHSIQQEEFMPKKKLAGTRTNQISDQLPKLPKHPFARSEPRLYPEDNEERPFYGEVITLRKRRVEPIYDVPQPRPRSSILDESLSMKRRHMPFGTMGSFGHSEFAIFARSEYDEQPHYATVKPRNSQTRTSYENICPSYSETSEEVVQDPIGSDESLHPSYADFEVNKSFVISMYV